MKIKKSLVTIMSTAALLVSTLNAFASTNEQLKPGKLISQSELKKIPNHINAKKVINITFQTETEKGAKRLSTGLVYEPKGKVPTGGWPVISWGHGTAGIVDKCAFSKNVLRKKNETQDFLNYFLNKGYAIVFSDYPGLGSPGKTQYLNSRFEGISIVDSVIAMHQLPINFAKKFTILGHSQGGASSLTAGNMANKILKKRNRTDLKYLGVASLGIPAKINYAIQMLGNPLVDNLVPNGAKAFFLFILAGFDEAYPEINLRKYLTKEGKSNLDATYKYCALKLGNKGKQLDFTKMFTRTLMEIPGFNKAIAEYLYVPTTGFDRPIFIGQGLQDFTVPFPVTAVLGVELQANKQPVDIHNYPGADHMQLLIDSKEDIDLFFKGLFR